MCWCPIHPGRETPKSNSFSYFQRKICFLKSGDKRNEMQAFLWLPGPQKYLSAVCVTFYNEYCLSPSYSLPVCCYCLKNNQQILIGISFPLREEYEAKFLSVSKGLWSPPKWKFQESTTLCSPWGKVKIGVICSWGRILQLWNGEEIPPLRKGCIFSSAKWSFSSTAPCFLVSGTSPCDEVHSGSVSFCILHLCPMMSRFYIWLCNSCLLKSRATSSLGLLGNQLWSLRKSYCSWTNFGFFAFKTFLLLLKP